MKFYEAEVAGVMLGETWLFLGHGIANCDDGRLAVFDKTGCLIFPAPARAIYEEIQARKAARMAES